MIDIKRKRYVELVAQKWKSWVHEYFFTIKTGNDRPWMKVAGNRQYFDSYFDKLLNQLSNIIQVYARGNLALQNSLQTQLNWYMANFDAVIMLPPAQLEVWTNALRRRTGVAKHLMSMIKDVMVPYYDSISALHGHDLVNELDIKTCPYCNRQFIHSFEALRAERPELDHYYPKATYPMLCLSFYNLIPVCHSCNHVKLEDEIGVNPYKRAFRRKFVIVDKNGNKVSKSRIYKLTDKEIKLRFEGRDADEEKNVTVLGLESVYNKHTDYVKELIDKSMAYDAHARKALVESFQGAGYHPRQVYDFVWGRHLMDAEFEDRPLSKLTKDMLDLLGIRRG